MERTFGVMPSDEVEMTEYYKESGNGDSFMIQAGPKGWSAVWEDGTNYYEDNITSTESNFERALLYVKNNVTADIELVTHE